MKGVIKEFFDALERSKETKQSFEDKIKAIVNNDGSIFDTFSSLKSIVLG